MLTSFSPLLKGFALESLGNAPTINREMTHEKGTIGYNHPELITSDNMYTRVPTTHNHHVKSTTLHLWKMDKLKQVETQCITWPKYKSKREFPSERGIVGFSCTNASSTRSMEIPLDITIKHKVLSKQSNTRLPNIAIQNLFTNKEMDPKCGKESNGR